MRRILSDGRVSPISRNPYASLIKYVQPSFACPALRALAPPSSLTSKRFTSSKNHSNFSLHSTHRRRVVRLNKRSETSGGNFSCRNRVAKRKTLKQIRDEELGIDSPSNDFGAFCRHCISKVFLFGKTSRRRRSASLQSGLVLLERRSTIKYLVIIASDIWSILLWFHWNFGGTKHYTL